MKKICIVGYGSIGRRHHNILKKIYGKEAKFDLVDLDTKLKIEDCSKKNYDILVISTPTNSHIDIFKNFKSINQIIFIEKPIDCDVEKVKKAKITHNTEKVHVGCNLRFTKAYKELMKIISETVFLRVDSMSYLPEWRKGIDHKKSYSSNLSMGGGIVLDFIHEPDYVFSLLGAPVFSSKIEKRLFDDITHDSSDTATLIWEYKDTAVSINLSYGSKNYLRTATCLLKSGETEVIQFTRDDINESYERQWRHILKEGPTNTFEDALKVLEIINER